MPDNNTNPIAVTFTADISAVETKMDQLVRDINRDLELLKASFKEANAQLRVAPQSDPRATEGLRSYRNEIATQVDIVSANLQRLSIEWERSAERIANAQRTISEIPTGRFLTAAQYAQRDEARQVIQTELANQENIIGRAGRLYQFSTASAAHPGEPQAIPAAPKPEVTEEKAAPVVAVEPPKTVEPAIEPPAIPEPDVTALVAEHRETRRAALETARAETPGEVVQEIPPAKVTPHVEPTPPVQVTQEIPPAEVTAKTEPAVPLPPPTPAAPTPPGLPEPYEVRRQDLIPEAETRPLRTAPFVEGTDYSEEALHARSIQNRNAETAPPEVPRHPIGTYSVDRQGELSQLRQYRLDDPRLIFPEGFKSNETVAKYADWIRAGSAPPPLTALETEQGNVKITEGHHRASAIRATGGETAEAYVALTQNVPIGRREDTGEVITSGRGITHEDAVRQALAAGKTVPPEVLADYPHLAAPAAAAVVPEENPAEIEAQIQRAESRLTALRAEQKAAGGYNALRSQAKTGDENAQRILNEISAKKTEIQSLVDRLPEAPAARVTAPLTPGSPTQAGPPPLASSSGAGGAGGGDGRKPPTSAAPPPPAEEPEDRSEREVSAAQARLAAERQLEAALRDEDAAVAQRVAAEDTLAAKMRETGGAKTAEVQQAQQAVEQAAATETAAYSRTDQAAVAVAKTRTTSAQEGARTEQAAAQATTQAVLQGAEAQKTATADTTAAQTEAAATVSASAEAQQAANAEVTAGTAAATEASVAGSRQTAAAAQQSTQQQSQSARSLRTNLTEAATEVREFFKKSWTEITSAFKSSAEEQQSLAKKKAETEIAENTRAQARIMAELEQVRAARKQAALEASALAAQTQGLASNPKGNSPAQQALMAEFGKQTEEAFVQVVNLDKQIDSLTNNLGTLQKAGAEASESLTTNFYKVSAIGGILRRLFGEGLPRAFEQIIAHTPALATAINSIFPIASALFMLQILGEMVAKIPQLVQGFAGWNERTKQQADDLAKLNRERIDFNLENQEKKSAQELVGLSGSARTRKEIELGQRSITERSAEATRDSRDAQKDAERLAEFESTSGRIKRGLEHITNAGNVIFGLNLTSEGTTRLNEEYERAKKAEPEDRRKAEQRTQDLLSRQTQQGERRKQLTVEEQLERIEIERTKIETGGENLPTFVQGGPTFVGGERYTARQIAAEQQETRQARALDRITPEEEARQLRAESEKEKANTLESIEKKRALIKEQYALDQDRPKAEKAELELDDEKTAAEQRNLQTISAINAQLTEEEMRQAQQVTSVYIESAYRRTETEAQLQEETARLQYEQTREAAEDDARVALGAAQKLQDQLLAAEKTRTDARREELNNRITLLSLEATKNKALIDELREELKQLDTEHAAAVNRIKQETGRTGRRDTQRADRQTEQIAQIGIQDETNQRLAQLKTQEEIVRDATREGIKPQVLANVTGAGQLPTPERIIPEPQTRTQNVLQTIGGAANPELQEAQQMAAIHREEYQEALQANQREQALYAKNPERMAELLAQQHAIESRYNQQRVQDTAAAVKAMEQRYLEFTHQVDQALFRGVNQWLQGQKTFAQAMAESWNEIVMDVVQDIEKMAAKWIEEHIIMMLIHKALAAVMGQTAAQAGADVAKHNTVNVLEASSDAALAASATLAWWSMINPPIAPAMASAQYAIGMGFASLAAFETGGIIPNTGIALVHEDEGVLPAPLTNMLMAAANGNAYTDAPPVPASNVPLGPGSAQHSATNISSISNSHTEGDQHVTVHAPITVHGNSQPDMPRLLEQHADQIGRIVTRQSKRFNR